MNLVITMSGQGLRFKEAGYNLPKYMIEAHSKTLFAWSMISLSEFNKPQNKFIFIVRKEDDAKDFIKAQCLVLGILNFNIIEIDYLTDGQASTAMLAKEYWDEKDELLIYNIDTYVEAGEIKYSDFKGDGFIPCFSAVGNHWSFVKLNCEGMAIEVREKERISDNCSLGAYYFKTCGVFKNLYKKYYSKDSTQKMEKYIAPLYNYLISEGERVYISMIDSKKVHVMGTPDELEQFLSVEDFE